MCHNHNLTFLHVVEEYVPNFQAFRQKYYPIIFVVSYVFHQNYRTIIEHSNLILNLADIHILLIIVGSYVATQLKSCLSSHIQWQMLADYVHSYLFIRRCGREFVSFVYIHTYAIMKLQLHLSKHMHQPMLAGE